MQLFLKALFMLSNFFSFNLNSNLNNLSTIQSLNLKLKDYPLKSLTKDLNKLAKQKISLSFYDDVAYFSISEFLRTIKPLIKNNDVTHYFKDDKVTVSLKTPTKILKVEFDYHRQTIIVSDNRFFTEILKNKERGELALNLEFLKLENLNINKQFELQLQNYQIRMLKDQTDIYLPFVLLNQLFLNQSNIQLYFNDSEVNFFRFAESLSDLIATVHLKRSPANQQNKIPNGLKQFQHRYLAFLLDHYYAIKPKNTTSYKDLLKKYHDQILATNSTDHYLATRKLIKELDDPHSTYILDGYYDKAKDFNKLTLTNNSNPRTEFKNQLFNLLASYDRPKFEYQLLSTADQQTGIIGFQGFDHSTAKHLENSLKQAKQLNLKNIVLDLSRNGGGFIGSAYEILGFLTDQAFKIYSYNPLSKDQKIETIKSKYQKYDFNYYVLISPYSFSAANIFAQITKDNNLAKVIGYQSFGGASAISYAVLPTGDIIQLSSNDVFTDKHFKSLEFGVSPDLKLPGNDINDFKNLYNYYLLQDLINKDNPSTDLANKTSLLALIKNTNLKVAKNDPKTLVQALIQSNAEVDLANKELIVILKAANRAEIYLANDPDNKITVTFQVVGSNHFNQSSTIILAILAPIIVILLVSVIVFFNKNKLKL
ncbi:S41 family peptidase [Mycoplasma putrefaciens]|uniref:S41 family peptidase n=1 Tax=Mycoplasma putrefaciens TaxID=2123 RepID=UPI003DA3BA11